MESGMNLSKAFMAITLMGVMHSFSMASQSVSVDQTNDVKNEKSQENPSIDYLGAFYPNKVDHIHFNKDGEVFASLASTKGMFLNLKEGKSSPFYVKETQGVVGFEFNSQGEMIIADFVGGAVLKRDIEGKVSILKDGLERVTGLAINSKDEVFSAIFNGPHTHSIIKINPDGSITNIATKLQVKGVIGIVFDDNDNLYAGSWDSGTVYKITEKGEITDFAKIPRARGNGINQITYGDGFLYVSAGSPRKLYRINSQTADIKEMSVDYLNLYADPLNMMLENLSGAIKISDDGKYLYMTTVAQDLIRIMLPK